MESKLLYFAHKIRIKEETKGRRPKEFTQFVFPVKGLEEQRNGERFLLVQLEYMLVESIFLCICQKD